MKILRDILGSKKGIAMLSAIAVYAVSKFGFDVSTTQVEPILYIIGSYIIGQGIADSGKSAAVIAQTTVVKKDGEP